jgi:two-component system heavy metal sensor histidine kinase CusS
VQSTLTETAWSVFVEDEGPGVPAEQREHIFERFVRVANSKRPEDRGSGLGLAICRSIIDLHGGQIFAAAAAPGGLRVTFEIPTAGKRLAAATPAGAFTLPELRDGPPLSPHSSQ